MTETNDASKGKNRMIHRFTSTTMPGEFWACDLCQRAVPGPGPKCLCQCAVADCMEQSATHRSMCDAHLAAHKAERARTEEEAWAALPVVPVDPAVAMFYCGRHDRWADDPHEMCWGWDDDGPATDCVVHPGIPKQMGCPNLRDIVSEAFYEAGGEEVDIPEAITEALDAAWAVIATHAPTVYYADTKVRISGKATMIDDDIVSDIKDAATR